MEDLSETAEEIGEEFNTALEELTVNSKPIINTLTIVAGENIHAAEAIVRVIENRIKQVSADKKLPSIYLLDSICKNIGGIYTHLFGQRIVKTFWEAYCQVSSSTRTSMVHLLNTWNSLFPSDAMTMINEKVKGLTQQHSRNRQQQQQDQGRAPPSARIHVNPNFVKTPPKNPPKPKGSRLDEIMQGKQKTERAIMAPTLPQYVESLKSRTDGYQMGGFHGHGSSGLLPDPPQQQGFSAQDFSSFQNLQGIPGLGQIDQYQLLEYLQKIQGMQSQSAPPMAPVQSNPYGYGYPTQPLQGQPSFQDPRYSANMFSSTPNYPNQSVPLDISNTLAQLSGYINSPYANLSTQPAVQPIIQPQPLLVPSLPSMTREPTRRAPSDLWSAESLKNRNESAISALYFDLPLQCKNCAIRFTDRQKMDLHLDWHYVQNRREKEKTKRAMSRNWYLHKEDWISGSEFAEKSAAIPFPFGDTIQPTEESESEVVSVPADENQTTCPVCGETFEQFWDSDQDQWMYQDAVFVSDTIYHQKCSGAVQPSSEQTSPTPGGTGALHPSAGRTNGGASVLKELPSDMPQLEEPSDFQPAKVKREPIDHDDTDSTSSKRPRLDSEVVGGVGS